MGAASAEELVARAESAERTGSRDQAAVLWDELIATFPSHPRALFLRGRDRMNEGDAAGALALFMQAEALDPMWPEAAFFAAVCHRHLGNPRAALIAVDRALALDP